MIKFLNSLLKHRQLVWTLAKNDIKSRYLGSALGAVWIFVLPLINLFIMWFAFEHGLKAGNQGDVPFILWLITGMFPWTFFADAIGSATSSVAEKSFLVKKVVFNVELLPFIKIVASSVLFIFLSTVMVSFFLLYHFLPDRYWMQVPYFMICIFSLIMSLSWFTSAIVVFYKDLGQLIAVSLQIGFWITPIFWSPERLPANLRFVTFLNPVNYVVSGYRDSFINKTWFWENPWQTLYFWTFVFLFSTLGLAVFKKLRPHFADVL
jgi:ABC-type polysaccharide/polyol phosphate export permease